MKCGPCKKNLNVDVLLGSCDLETWGSNASVSFRKNRDDDENHSISSLSTTILVTTIDFATVILLLI